MPKKPISKAKPKPKMKAKAKTSPKAKAAKKPQKSPRGFMWKLLEQKQQAQKERAVLPTGAMPNDGPSQPHHHDSGFSRFNGPRRKAG